MLVQRQFNAMLFNGNPVDIVDGKKLIWQFRDIEPRNKLKIAHGLSADGSIILTASQTYEADLPQNYDSSKYLAFYCVSTSPILVTVTRNPSTSSNYLYIFATDSSSEGEHFGHLSFQEKNITGITFRNLVSMNLAEISWIMYEMPSLTSPDSWKDGVQTLGVVS